MKKRRTEVWITNIKKLIKSLKFSSLDEEMQRWVNNEINFFNTRRLGVISLVAMAMEALNIINVVFFSPSGLTTANNIQYFAMYLLMFVSGALCLIVRRLLRQKPTLWQRCCVGFTLYWALWHSLLSAMDLRRNPNITVFITGMFVMSLLVRLKPWEALCIMPSGFICLLCFSTSTITNGIIINAFIITAVAVLVSCSRYFNTLEELDYRQKLILQTNRRTSEKQRLNMLLNQQKALLHYSCELTFIWDKEEDMLALNSGKSLCPQDRQTLLLWLTKGSGKTHGILTLYLESKKAPSEYQVESIVQLDGNNLPICAVGIIMHTDCGGNNRLAI